MFTTPATLVPGNYNLTFTATGGGTGHGGIKFFECEPYQDCKHHADHSSTDATTAAATAS